MIQDDFVIRIGTVNGTGSASANGILAKSFFRMGHTIGIKNLFPSNIQGLPTWYEIRVSKDGHTSRRGGVDIFFAMNSETFEHDEKELNKGGFLIYDSSKHQKHSRDDIHYIEVPITELLKKPFPDVKKRLLLRNMCYLGVCIKLLGADTREVITLIKDQYGKKAQDSIDSFYIGHDYIEQNPQKFDYSLSSQKRKDDMILMEGNEACALGCVYGGATVASWYPITPSTSLIDYFKYHSDTLRKPGETEIIQAEDEIAALGMVLGANWAGSRSFTATSGPGISLMSEFLGYAYYAEIPAVLFNVQRCGPSTGMPTRTQQADLLLCAYASHGDTKHILLFPSSILECFQMSAEAFNYADMFQTPVFVMSDLDIAMNESISEPLFWDSWYDRGKIVKDTPTPFHRYLDKDGDGICERTLPGTSPAYFTRGSGHDKWGRYTEDGRLYAENMVRLDKKFETALDVLPKPEINILNKHKDVGVIFIGTTQGPLKEALSHFDDRFNTMRIRSFPFHSEVESFCSEHEKLIVIDQNRDAQLLKLLAAEFRPTGLQSLCYFEGFPPVATQIATDLEVFA